MSAPDTAIAVAPIRDALQPLVTAAVSTAVAGVVGIDYRALQLLEVARVHHRRRA